MAGSSLERLAKVAGRVEIHYDEREEPDGMHFTVTCPDLQGNEGGEPFWLHAHGDSVEEMATYLLPRAKKLAGGP